MENFLRCHLTIIRLLDRAQELNLLSEVKDEGGFWEQRDAAKLVETIGQWNRHLAGFVGPIDDGYGIVQKWESRDFLILASDLVLNGSQTLPQRGDRIQEIHAGTTYTYEVLAPGKEPAWRYSDPYRKTLRIHTKQIGV